MTHPEDDNGSVNDAVREYIDTINPEHRPMFDRIHQLVLEVHPDADVVLSYRIPTFTVGRHRLYVGVWKHGLSFYGWQKDRAAGFTTRHPELVTSTGTIKLRPQDAERIPDDELSDLVRAALDR